MAKLAWLTEWVAETDPERGYMDRSATEENCSGRDAMSLRFDPNMNRQPEPSNHEP